MPRRRPGINSHVPSTTVGPYGEVWHNPRTGHRQTRLTQEGVRLVEGYLREHPDPIRLLWAVSPRVVAAARAVLRDEDSLRQMAMLGVVVAATKFDPAQGKAFATVACYWMGSEFSRVLSKSRFAGRGAAVVRSGDMELWSGPDGDPLTLFDTVGQTREPDAEGESVRREELALLGAALDRVGGRDRWIVGTAFGLDGESATKTGLGRAMGTTRQNAIHHKAAAVSRLRRELERSGVRG